MELNLTSRLYEFDSTADVYAASAVAVLVQKNLTEDLLGRMYEERVLQDHSLLNEFFLPEIRGPMVSFILVETNCCRY